jgi:hypothetical protein
MSADCWYLAGCVHEGACHTIGRCLDWPDATPTAAYDARAVQLDRMAKHNLLTIVRQHAAERGAPWVFGGPELWSKDELIADILRSEFPEVNR